MSQAQVTITKRGAERARGGHLWIYRSDVRDAAEAEGGSVVRVRDERGRAVGQALYSSRSEIALRLLTARDDVRVRGLEGLPLRTGVLYGEEPGELEVEQHGERIRVAPPGGQKTGAF